MDRNVPRGCRVKNEDGVLGTVVDTCAKVTLQIINTNHVIENVPIQDLKPVSVCLITTISVVMSRF